MLVAEFLKDFKLSAVRGVQRNFLETYFCTVEENLLQHNEAMCQF